MPPNYPNPTEFTDLWDLAYVLTHEYNALAAHLLDAPMLSEAWVHEQLADMFETDDVEILAESDFGRGLIMGALRVRYTLIELDSEEDD